MKLTKEIVDRLIAANRRNRKIATGRVKSLARAMTDGMYVPSNGQTIVVNKSWTWLLDGQHRLHAIRLACYPVFDIPVVEVDDSEAEHTFNTIDVCRGNRNAAQVISLNNEIPCVSNVVAMINFYHDMHGVHNLNPERILRFYNEHKVIVEGVKAGNKSFVTKRAPSSPIMAAVLNACLKVNEWRTIYDIHYRIMEGDARTPAERALMAILIKECSRNRDKRSDSFFKYTKGLLKGDLKQITFRDGEDRNALLCKVI